MNPSKLDFKNTSFTRVVNDSKIVGEKNLNINLATKTDNIDVILMFIPKYDKEYIPNVRVSINENGDVNLHQLMEFLKSKSFPIENNIVSYYSYSKDMFVYCGSDPVSPQSYIPASEVASTGETKQITVRIRQVNASFNVQTETLNEQSKIKVEAIANETTETGISDEERAPKQKRTKERKIGEILDKVLQWRKLYTGVADPATGQVVKLSLEDAAQKVGISKKSLDDYLLQIRFGKKHGFNFNEHYHDRVGVLRSFVKKYKNKKNDKVEDENFDLPNEFDGLIPKKEKNDFDVKTEATPGISKRSKKIP